MGAFVLAGLIAFGTFLVAIFAEFARGMAPAPSMQPSYFLSILIPGLGLAALVAVSHWLPHIGW
jgi:hypothetical protein